MRAAEFDERTNPSAVLYYAPRRGAAAAGSSIKPVLERLSCGERRTRPLTEPVPPAPKEEPIGAPGPGAVRMSALEIAARFFAVAGAGIGIAVIVASRSRSRGARTARRSPRRRWPSPCRR